ncbi:response regulator transcription factor [Paracidovorax cattleyae]|uniref:DNA-binding response regulator, NarL/FixJ family, contains REC and HTH domains n=1 Tax=Paracidovorax cattleyae TaxID=80868 RepID=A0A1H0VP75_9BURK|nr:response regulator transcription factor [Paracidovorax cattleyae]AVS75861.1 DNA-binding response regulator [Paracidovorax cattleyae]MBF9263347.1 response regulator transcription factor [Paracidovorax cattleyae]SDP79978.1 DNA-binding response regulator, NarL/FixJ family, contains REC and HTH domains [Paracidovorax cattleyae]
MFPVPESRPSSPSRHGLVVDDHPLVARGMTEFLRLHPRLDTARHAHSMPEAMRAIAQHGAPAVALVDFWLADGATAPFIRDLLALAPQARVLMMSGDHHPAIAIKSRASGAHGFIHKQESPATFTAAVAAVLDGDCWFAATTPGCTVAASSREVYVDPADMGLTPRQGQILSMVLEGRPNKPIASALHVSEHTVKEHVTVILQKLGVRNRIEAIAKLQGVRLDIS